MSNLLRDHGYEFGIFPTTANNHIADLEGIKIGHKSITNNADIHTGVTIIQPHGRHLYKHKAFAGFSCSNGFGKFAGSTQVEEGGTLECNIGLTNTLSVGTVMQEIVRSYIKTNPDMDIFTLNAVVGECNEGFLNNVAKITVKPEDVHDAIADLKVNDFSQGCIGAGTGMRAFAYKGGLGSAARIVPATFTKVGKDYKLGVMIMSNFGGFLEFKGTPLWKKFGGNRYQQEIEAMKASGGSCIILVATDAPMMPFQLKRLAHRANATLTKVGSYISMGSGDYSLAWSTNPDAAVNIGDWDILNPSDPAPVIKGDFITDDSIDPFYQAVVEATEEAFWNSLTTSETCNGFRGTTEALSCEKIIEALKE